MPAMADGFSGGMIALVPSEDDVDNLALTGGEDPFELHLTLTYLGPDSESIEPERRREIEQTVERLAGQTAPIAARVFAHSTFNPDRYKDRDPCAVYLIGDTDALGPFASAEQNEPFIPHVTAGYDRVAADLSYTGPVTFNALRLAMGEDNVIIPLTGGEEEFNDDDESGDDSDGADRGEAGDSEGQARRAGEDAQGAE
jgi:hypothetical protein